jgi:hypothetical protein
MTTRSKILLENPMQPAATNSKAWKVSCTVQQHFQLFEKLPARCSNISKRLESFLHPLRQGFQQLASSVQHIS